MSPQGRRLNVEVAVLAEAGGLLDKLSVARVGHTDLCRTDVRKVI
jgi:hypothetical protein